jgi:hypothetical protein
VTPDQLQKQARVRRVRGQSCCSFCAFRSVQNENSNLPRRLLALSLARNLSETYSILNPVCIPMAIFFFRFILTIYHPRNTQILPKKKKWIAPLITVASQARRFTPSVWSAASRPRKSYSFLSFLFFMAFLVL